MLAIAALLLTSMQLLGVQLIIGGQLRGELLLPDKLKRGVALMLSASTAKYTGGHYANSQLATGHEMMPSLGQVRSNVAGSVGIGM